MFSGALRTESGIVLVLDLDRVLSENERDELASRFPEPAARPAD
jgi:chemotaxis signal transduction protein